MTTTKKSLPPLSFFRASQIFKSLAFKLWLVRRSFKGKNISKQFTCSEYYKILHAHFGLVYSEISIRTRARTLYKYSDRQWCNLFRTNDIESAGTRFIIASKKEDPENEDIQEHENNMSESPGSSGNSQTTSIADEDNKSALQNLVLANNQPQQHETEQGRYRNCCLMSVDADQSFLNSLHPYLKEMTPKQNRQFRLKVMQQVTSTLDGTNLN